MTRASQIRAARIGIALTLVIGLTAGVCRGVVQIRSAAARMKDT
jgi:hypothetical protein